MSRFSYLIRPARNRYQNTLRQRRQRFRQLLTEQLERRTLLTTITSVDPPANSHDISLSTDVSATFDMDVNAGSVTADSFVVHGTRSGRLVNTAISVAGPVITSSPSGTFSPGEKVRVTATSDITTAGGAATPRVWQFIAEVTAGSGQFEDSGQVFNNSNQGEQASFADVDGDGDLDLLEGSEFLWLNDGNGVFTDSGQVMGLNCTNSCGQGGGVEPRFGDVDSDGDIDIVGTGSVLLNDGNGVFTGNGQNLDGGSTISVGDLDADGDLDLMQGLAYGPSRVWFNDGNGQFTNSGQALGASAFGFEFGDFDNDGDLDAFAANNGPTDGVWLNDGNGVFTDSGQSLGGFRSTREVDVGDIDGDGDLDAIVTAENDGIPTGTRIWINAGDATFTEQLPALDPGGRGRTVELGDLDGDGDLDLMVANLWNPAASRVWVNDGSGSFTGGQTLSFSGDNVVRRVEGGGLGDVDGDGDLDFWEANVGTGGSRLWINQNTQPSVSLSIDNPNIDEAEGMATVTATLSAVHTEEVSVLLDFSGLATEPEDYTTSADEITIPVGATTGTVVITAVQDGIDEPDETILVDISDVSNADEAGTQQVETIIVDDDEPVPVPDVTLTVDNAEIPEADGTATFTATLSELTTVPVTVEFAFSGTAAGDDYNASATEIVVQPNTTSGSITVTAVQDPNDEPNETVVVAISNVIGGTEVGTQEQTTTIVDDDEPVMPDVTLSVDNPEIAEAEGSATLTVTLSEATTAPVTVALAVSGTADAGDFTASTTEVVIAPGGTTGSVTITAIQDEVNEPDETVIVEIDVVTNGNEDGEQSQTITILDDDIPPTFAVTSLTPHASGFQLEFANALDASEINLFDTGTAGAGTADVLVTGATSGPVTGSLVLGESSLTFIKSGGPLEPDTYMVSLRSAEDGFKDAGGMLLDGDGDGTAGDDYAASFDVDETAAAARQVQIADFVRGPGQPVNLPADAVGIPITLSDGDGVRAVDLQISYDPSLLEITDATAPAGGTVVLNTLTPGLAILVYFNASSLPAGETTFINLEASVPTENASAIYGTSQVLDVHGVVVGDGNDNEFPALADDALHLASYFADVSGNGRVNAGDAAQVARFAALIDSGFSSSLITDPTIVGDISGNDRINAADASLVARFAALLPVDQIPDIPAGVAVTGRPAPGPIVDPLQLPITEEAGSPEVARGPVADAHRDPLFDSYGSEAALARDITPTKQRDFSADTKSLAHLLDDDELVRILEEAMSELLTSGG